MSTPLPPPDGSGTPPPPPGAVPPGYGAPPPPGGAVMPPPPDSAMVPPPPPSAPPYQAGTYGPVPGYGPAPGFEQKPPRPDARLGAGLIIAGAVLAVIGVFLPWISGFEDFGSSDSINGMDLFISSDFETIDGPGAAMIVLAVILIGLGIALFFAGRVLAVAIIAIVVSAIAVLAGVAMIDIANSTTGLLGGDLAIGVILQPIAPLASLAGSIVVTAKRRR